MKIKNFKNNRPIIAVIYLAPTLGYKDFPGMDELINKACEDCEVLIKCGVDGVLLENENDRPYNVLASNEAIASVSIVGHELRKKYSNEIILGTEYLINDPKASLASAKAAGHSFIRTDYFVDNMSREEYGGQMHIDPVGIIEYQQKIGANDIALFTDIQVKYATMIDKRSLKESALLAKKHNSDGVIVSSHQTGIAPNLEDLYSIQSSDTGIPVIIGSGLSHQNLKQIYPLCDGAIVGSALMTNVRMDYDKVASFMDIVRSLRA